MKDFLQDTERRARFLGEYIVENKATVRSAAAATGISKSTVHKEVTQRLSEVRYILETNKSERHIRGGNATREKYRRLSQKQNNT